MQFLNMPDDGTHFFAGTQLYTSATIALQDANYEIDDMAMINFEQFDPITITVHKDSEFETLDDLIETMQNSESGLSYSTVYGGALHLTGTLLEDLLDIKLNPVFYDGGGEIRNALLGNHVDFMIGNAAGDAAIADQVRVLAIASAEPMEIWPEAELINDALAKYDVELPYVGSARFLAAHASFREKHPELFNEIVAAYEAMFESKAYQEHIERLGMSEVSEIRGPEVSDQLNHELHELMIQYQPQLSPE